MDYKFLANKEIEKFFEETEFSVGEVLLSILQQRFTGVKIQNKSKMLEMTDQEWYEAIEKAFQYESEQ